MTAVQTLSNKASQLKLMSLYESRLNRTLLTTMKQLEARQAARKHRQEEEMKEALEIQKVFQMKGLVYNPADDGFAFSPKRFEMYQLRNQHWEEVKIARRVGYNLKNFQAALADSQFQSQNSN
jgi:cysteinyl-tRNA synthetase